MRRKSKAGNVGRYAIFLAIVFISSIMPSFGQMSGNYTLSSTGNFTSFDAAVDSLIKNGVNGPVVINVTAGIYNQSVTVNAIKGASATNTITFQSAGHDSTSVILETASIAGTGRRGAATLSWTLAFSGCDHVTFKWMTIARTDTNVSAVAVKIDSGACHNAITDCILRGVKIKTAPAGTAYEEVVYASHTASFDDSFNTISNNLIKYGTYGIYLTYAGAGGRGGGTPGEVGLYDNINNNIIDSAFSNGIFLDYIDSSSINGNSITNIQEAPGAGTGFGAPVTPIGIEVLNASVVYVEQNRINMINGGDGIYLGSIVSGSGQNSIVANNMITIGGTSGYGIYVPAAVTFGGNTFTPGNVSLSNFYYNSILVTNSGPAAASAGIYFASANGLNNNSFENNIAYNSGGGLAVNFSNTVDLLTVDYNDWYTKGPNLGGWGGANYSIANWESITAVDSHSVYVNPMFASIATLNASAAACYHAGTPDMVKDDFYGKTRNATTPCIGANEFTLVANDAGISAVDSPSGSYCRVGAANVYVTLSDFGINTLTSVKIGWSVNGISQTTYSWTGSDSTGKNIMANIGSYTFAANTTYSIKAWTINPDGMTDSNHTNDTTFIPVLRQGMGGTYVIGTTAPSDYTTIGAAIADVRSRGLCGPVTFNIEDGNYTEQDSVNAIPGSSAVNTVTFQSKSGDSTKVNWNYPSNAALNYVITMSGATYVTFKQITFNRPYTAGNVNSRIIDFSYGECHNLTFINNRFMGVYNSGNGLLRCVGDQDSNITIAHNLFKSGGLAIYLSGLSGSEHINDVIDNNIIDSTTLESMVIEYATQTTITTNTITNAGVGAANGGYGIYLEFCDGALNVSNNRIQATTGSTGIYDYDCTGTTSTPGMIYNNLISVAAGTGANGYSYGILEYYSSYHNIYFNNIDVYQTSTEGYCVYAAGNVSPNIENNNLVNTGGGYSMYLMGASTNYGLTDYNNLYSPGGDIAYWNTTSYTSLSSFIAASGDSNTISVDPFYRNNTDLYDSNTALFGMGTPIIGISTDIYGKRRHKLPTIGAVELSIHYNDAGLAGVDNPVGSTCGGKSNITVTLKNFGLGALKSAIINWEINGTLQPAYTFNGNLAFDGTTVITLNYDFSIAGKTTLTAWTTSPNGVTDSVTSNDSATSSFIVNLPPALLSDLNLQVHPGDSLNIGANAVPGDSYSWVSYPAGFTSTSSNPRVGPADSSIYILTETNGYGCSTIDTVKVAVNLAIAPITNIKSLQVCPNPFSSNLVVSYTLSQSEMVTAAIYDINGKEIMPLTNEIQGAGQYTLHFDGSVLPAGVYIFRMTAGASAVNEKIIKVN